METDEFAVSGGVLEDEEDEEWNESALYVPVTVNHFLRTLHVRTHD